jgi:hypothetical protein
VLAVVTGRLVKGSKDQTAAMQDQVTAIRDTTRDQVTVIRDTTQDQVTAIRDTAATELATVKEMAAMELAAVREQIDASVKGNEAVREAARAQLQPMVFAHADAIRTCPDREGLSTEPRGNEYQLGPGQIGFGYRLKNEGTGIALNIEHGVDVGGHEIAYGGGMRFRALRPDEAQPAFDYIDPQGHLIRIVPLAVVADERQIPEDWSSRVYWARFDNVFGERFETRNPSDPSRAAEFRRIDPE